MGILHDLIVPLLCNVNPSFRADTMFVQVNLRTSLLRSIVATNPRTSTRNAKTAYLTRFFVVVQRCR